MRGLPHDQYRPAAGELRSVKAGQIFVGELLTDHKISFQNAI